MKRLFAFVIKVALLLALVLWLSDQPGTAHIEWHDYVIETSAALLGVAAFAIGFAIYLLWRIWRFIVNGPEMWRLRRKLNRAHEGQQRLAEGLAAIAAGDAAEAGRHAIAARKMLGVSPATRLLQAQAAQLAGDRKAAREIFLTMAAESDSAILGYRGLIMETMRNGNHEEAERLLEKLRRLRPETPWINLIRFELAARRQAWDEAGEALEHISHERLMEPERVKQHQAATLLATAQIEARQGHFDRALEAAERAARLAPHWPPAAIALARQQIQAGHKRAAQRTVERAWSEKPHPHLATAYRASSDSEPVDAYRKLERLCENGENRPLNHLVLGQAALEADLWGEARRHLMAMIENGVATRSTYQLLAKVEQRENGKEELALQWLRRAVDAPADPVWLCRSCGAAHEEWQTLCRYCSAFDMMEWQAPGQSRISDTGTTALLAPSWNE